MREIAEVAPSAAAVDADGLGARGVCLACVARPFRFFSNRYWSCLQAASQNIEGGMNTVHAWRCRDIRLLVAGGGGAAVTTAARAAAAAVLVGGGSFAEHARPREGGCFECCKKVQVISLDFSLGCFLTPTRRKKKSFFLVHVAGVLKNVFGGPFGSLRRWRTSPGAFLTMGTCAGAARIFL